MLLAVKRTDEAYEPLRQSLIWNARVPDRFPQMIYQPESKEEVAALIRGIIPEDQHIGVRSGGHNWLGASLRDGSALLDLGSLNSVTVDLQDRVAHVGPGATHQVLADAIVSEGLAFPIGHCPSVGLGGYLLAGGLGWNLHEWGPACWSVVGADLVLADGRIERVDVEQNPDLFWALRGASAGFPGVVTSFTLALQSLPHIVSRRLPCALELLPDLLGELTGLLAGSPGLEIAVIIRRPAPDQAPRAIVVGTSFDASRGRASARLERAFALLTDSLTIADRSHEVTVVLNQLEGDGGWQRGLRYFADTSWVAGRPQDVGLLVVEAMRNAPSVLTRIVLSFAYRPPNEPDVALTPFSNLSVNLYATWEHAAYDAVNVSWVRESAGMLDPVTSGHYVGESDMTSGPTRLEASYSPESLTRLKGIVAAFDPTSRFDTFLIADEGAEDR